MLRITRGLSRSTHRQTINAQEAKEVGLVNEVLPLENLLPRAWELARYLKMRSPLLRRYSRVLATQELKKKKIEERKRKEEEDKINIELAEIAILKQEYFL